MGGFDAHKTDAAFFAGTNIRSNILVNIGYGDASKLYPRSPRFACEESQASPEPTQSINSPNKRKHHHE